MAHTAADVEYGGPAEDDEWTEKQNDRRCNLIDKKYKGALTDVAEVAKLKELQERAIEHLDRVCPLPIEEVKKMNRELVAKKAKAEESTPTNPNPLGHTPPPDFKGDPARHCGPQIIDLGPSWPFALVLVLYPVVGIGFVLYLWMQGE